MTRIVVVGTYDTKAKPLSTLEAALRALGEEPITIDTSVFTSNANVTYSAEAVAEYAGERHGDLPPRGRAEAVRVMAQGAAGILGDLVSRGEVGVLALMGGSNAATVFTHLVPEVPMGIPKILMRHRFPETHAHWSMEPIPFSFTPWSMWTGTTPSCAR